jgi:hypothetical protein
MYIKDEWVVKRHCSSLTLVGLLKIKILNVFSLKTLQNSSQIEQSLFFIIIVTNIQTEYKNNNKTD